MSALIRAGAAAMQGARRSRIWTPAQDGTVLHWWDPIDATGAPVAALSPRVGGMSLAQAVSGDQPGLTTINGRAATDHQFSGTRKFLSGTFPSPVPQPYALWFVLELSGSVNIQFFYGANGPSNDDMYAALNTHFSGWYLQAGGVSFIQGGGAGGSMVGPYACCFVYNGASSALYANNNFATPVATGTTGTQQMDGTFTWGAQAHNPSGQPSRAKHGACVISAGVPPTNQLRNYGAYFSKIYPGLSVVTP